MSRICEYWTDLSYIQIKRLDAPLSQIHNNVKLNNYLERVNFEMEANPVGDKCAHGIKGFGTVITLHSLTFAVH
jgi:hypothetical protein